MMLIHLCILGRRKGKPLMASGVFTQVEWRKYVDILGEEPWGRQLIPWREATTLGHIGEHFSLTNAPYCRTECLEIAGIPSAINDSDLEDVVCCVINKAGVALADTFIEDCHRVGKRRQIIVKFARRKVS